MKIGPWGRRGLVVRASACGAGGPRFKSRLGSAISFAIAHSQNGWMDARERGRHKGAHSVSTVQDQLLGSDRYEMHLSPL